MRAVLGGLVLVVGATLAGSASAAPESNAARCVAAAQRGQTERDEGRLVESRVIFVSCGEETCPAVVRKECLRWLGEVDERIPSIVVSVKDGAGKDILDAAVTLDGKPLAVASQGRELPVNPGRHSLTAAGAKTARVEETVVVAEREKGRKVSLVFPSPVAAVPKPAPVTPEVLHRPVPVLTWILGGVAVLGGAGFAYFWSKGMDEVGALRGSCAPYCSSDQVDDAAGPLNIGRVSLGVGIAAAVGAIVVYFARPSEPVTLRTGVVSPPSRPASRPGFDIRF